MRQTYVAVEGDTLYSIAIHFYGSDKPDGVAKIAAASGIYDPNDLQPGQIVTIPTP